MRKRMAILVLVVAASAGCGGGDGMKEERKLPELTKAEQRRAKTMTAEDIGANIDRQTDEEWEARPKSGQANVRILTRHQGELVRGKWAPEGGFRIVMRKYDEDGALDGDHSMTFIPNPNGRFVYEDLPPAAYDVTIKSMTGEWQTWTKTGLRLAADDVVTLEVDLVK